MAQQAKVQQEISASAVKSMKTKTYACIIHGENKSSSAFILSGNLYEGDVDNSTLNKSPVAKNLPWM